MNFRCSTIIAFVSACWCLLGPTAAFLRGQNARPAEVSLRQAEIGFGGVYKSGFWTPIWLTLERTAGSTPVQVEILSSDGDNLPVVFVVSNTSGGDPSGSQKLWDLPTGKPQTLLGYAKIGPQRGALSLRVRAGGEAGEILLDQRLSVPPPIAATRELALALGGEFGLEKAMAYTRRPDDVALAAATVSDVSRLPDAWWGYEGVETIFFLAGPQQPAGSTPAGQDAADKAPFWSRLSQRQISALEQWVQLGGRLILSVGADGEKVLAAGTPWRKLLPGAFVGVAPLRESSGLENYTSESLQLKDDDAAHPRPLTAEIKNPQGQVEVWQGGQAAETPLVVKSLHGLGQVTFVALDLDAPALSAWPGRPRLLVNLLQGAKQAKSQTATSTGRLGYRDLTGQLRASLDQFEGVTAVNFTTVSILIIVYILLIGPVDFFVLRQLNLPRNLTWITFPTVTLLFCGLAWYLSQLAHGDQAAVHQVEVVDVDLASQIVRGTVWTDIYCPQTRTVDLSLTIDRQAVKISAPPQATFSWQGLPGDGLGGLASRQISPGTLEPYRIDSPGEQPLIHGLPIQIASSKHLSGRWWGRTTIVAAPTLSFGRFEGLKGEVRNPLPIPLTDCLLIHGNSLYKLGALPADGALPLPKRVYGLDTFLAHKQIVDGKEMQSPWNREATYLPEIINMLMFYDTAGGQTYTGLTHRYQPYLDLSAQIRGGQAILMGRAETPIASASALDAPLSARQRHWTWIRIVTPVAIAQPKEL